MRKKKIKRQSFWENYYYVWFSSTEAIFIVICDREQNCCMDDFLYNQRNYFLIEKDAQAVADKINKDFKFNTYF